MRRSLKASCLLLLTAFCAAALAGCIPYYGRSQKRVPRNPVTFVDPANRYRLTDSPLLIVLWNLDWRRTRPWHLHQHQGLHRASVSLPPGRKFCALADQSEGSNHALARNLLRVWINAGRCGRHCPRLQTSMGVGFLVCRCARQNLDSNCRDRRPPRLTGPLSNDRPKRSKRSRKRDVLLLSIGRRLCALDGCRPPGHACLHRRSDEETATFVRRPIRTPLRDLTSHAPLAIEPERRSNSRLCRATSLPSRVRSRRTRQRWEAALLWYGPVE